MFGPCLSVGPSISIIILRFSIDNIAIASHKFVVSFCVCLEMQQSGTRLPMFFTYLSVFSLMSPLGEAIGIILTESGGSGVGDDIVASLQGLAAGTLLYVAMFEILSRERANNVSGLVQLLGICSGFAFMILVETFAAEPEEQEAKSGHCSTAEVLRLLQSLPSVNTNTSLKMPAELIRTLISDMQLTAG